MSMMRKALVAMIAELSKQCDDNTRDEQGESECQHETGHCMRFDTMKGAVKALKSHENRDSVVLRRMIKHSDIDKSDWKYYRPIGGSYQGAGLYIDYGTRREIEFRFNKAGKLLTISQNGF